MITTLACPNCRASEQLATIEEITGHAVGGAQLENGERTFIHAGWTDVIWDTSTTVGVTCRGCMWDGQLEDLIESETP